MYATNIRGLDNELFPTDGRSVYLADMMSRFRSLFEKCWRDWKDNDAVDWGPVIVDGMSGVSKTTKRH